MTPEQMRVLADEGDDRALDILTRSPGAVYKLTAALRAAADQLEAVDRWLWLYNNYLSGDAIDDLSAILTADTAPHESNNNGKH